MEHTKQKDYVGYEYKEIVVDEKRVSQYLDGYLNFGWVPDENHEIRERGSTTLRLKRDRKIINKAELTRLQRNFEDCMKQIEGLEQSRHSTATVVALILGILGTAFIAGATFAVVHQPPIIWLCIVLAIPGFIGWITPYFAYTYVLRKRAAVVTPLIEAKYEEIYSVCERGNRLLGIN
ncbi:MAG: hypothetical protein ACRDBO_13645 [Lachnospiraceae bacterium]